MTRTDFSTLADLEHDKTIEPSIVAAWQAAFASRASAADSVRLTELQALVANDPIARDRNGGNLVIAGPTSSGKTLAAEIMMARQLTPDPRFPKRTGCIYAVPLRALATEKWERFKRIYGEDDVFISSGDYQDQDSLILNRRRPFRVAVVVYEKLYAWFLKTNARNALLSKMGMLVVDELQMLGDVQRGPRLELLLTLVRRLQLEVSPPPRLVCLGPHRDALSPVAEWLNAQIIAPPSDERPVPLAQGYICPGKPATFVDLDPRLTQSQVAIPELRATTRDAMVKELVGRLLRGPDGRPGVVGSGKRILIYSPTKDGAEKTAEALATTLGIRQKLDANTEERVDALEQTHATSRFKKTIASGVGFHHGDLTLGERALVEDLFRAEAPGICLDVVICTPTLAMGVNLPADYMLFTSAESYRPKDWDERGNVHTPLSPLEYRNFSGRAGRYRPNAPPDHHGVALFVSDRPEDEIQREIVDPIICGKITPVLSEMHRWPFGIESLALAIADDLSRARKSPPTKESIVKTFEQTYAGRLGTRLSHEGELLPVPQAALLKLEALANRCPELISPDMSVQLSGNVVARAGIHILTYQALRDIAGKVREGILDRPLVILEKLSVVPEIVRLYPSRFPDQAIEQARITHALRNFFKDLVQNGHEVGERATRLITTAHVPDRNTLEALMRVAAVWLWIEGRSAEHLGAQAMLPDIRYGACSQLGDQLHWLLSALPDLWFAAGFSEQDESVARDRRWAMARLERRLRFGVPDPLVGIAQLRVPGLHRENMMQLWTAVAKYSGQARGWEHPVELLDLPAEAAGTKRMKKLLRSVQEAIHLRPWRDDPRAAWKKQVDIARAALRGVSQRYVANSWPEIIERMWGSKDPDQQMKNFVEALASRPLKLNLVSHGSDTSRPQHFITYDGREILVGVAGDGETVPWKDIHRLWGTQGPSGRPVRSVVVLALGTTVGIRDELSRFGEALRVVTREAFGRLVAELLVNPEHADEAEPNTADQSVVGIVRGWLCGPNGAIAETEEDAENILQRGGDDEARLARWVEGRSGIPKKAQSQAISVAERGRRERRVQTLRDCLDVWAEHPGTASGEIPYASEWENLQKQCDRVVDNFNEVVAAVRGSLEGLTATVLGEYGAHSQTALGATIETRLERIKKQGLVPTQWTKKADDLRDFCNPAVHRQKTPAPDGTYPPPEYTFKEAADALEDVIQLWNDYLDRGAPTAQLTRVRPR